MLLDAGSKAPFSGFLVPREKIIELRNTDIENKEYKLINASLTRSIDTYKKNEDLSQQQYNIMLDRNDKLSKELNSARSTTTFETTAWFIGGVIVTGLATYGASRLK